MTTLLNDNAGYVSALGGGSTATHQGANSAPDCCKDQAFVVKVQHDEDIRRLTVPELSWAALLKRVAEAFKLPESKVALKYKDEEGDLVTIQSTEELLEAHRTSLRQESLLRLYAFVGKRKQVPHPVASTSTASCCDATTTAPPLQLQDPFAELKSPEFDLKAQKKALKEEKKALKAERKALHHHRKEEWKDKKKLAKEEFKHRRGAVSELREQIQAPFDPSLGSWRDQRRALCKELKKEKEEMRRCKRELKIEQRMAYREARRQGMAEKRNKVIARFVKHVTIPDGTQIEPGRKFIKTWRLRNEGEEAWTDCKLLFVSKRNGDQMGAPESVSIPSPVPPQETVDVSVEMIAPEQPGRYVGFWRLSAADGRKFGQRVWVKIDVIVSSSSSEDEKEKEKVKEEVSKPREALGSSFDKLEAEVEQSFFDIKEEKDTYIDAKNAAESELIDRAPSAPAIEASPSSSPSGKPTIASLLKQLKDLGFSEDVGRNIMLLKKYDGDVNKVIAELIA